MLDGMGGSVASEQQSEVDGMKVMVIDDSKTIRRTAETLLKKECPVTIFIVWPRPYLPLVQ